MIPTDERSSLRNYWVTVCVVLNVPIRDIGDESSPNSSGLVAGYYLNLGVTAAGEALARELAEKAVGDGVVDWSDSTVHPVDVAGLDSAVVGRSGNWDEAGVWYRSGRAFFPADA